MGQFNLPKIVTNGLVFSYDMNNIKSYKGPVIENKIKQILPRGTGTATGYVSTGGYEYVDIPQLGPTLVSYNNIQNNYTSHSPNSNNCCPSLFGYGQDIALSGSTLYTYAIVYKSESGYTHPNFMYRYEYNGGTYVTEAGVHNDSNRIHLGDNWYWAWGTFTTQATTTRLNDSGMWYYRYSPYNDKVSVAKVLLVQGNYTTLHPKYWPEINVNRTNTMNVVDLMNTSTITASSLTYASDGTFSFNGSSDYLQSTYIPSITVNTDYTFSAWINTSNGGVVFQNSSGASDRNGLVTSTTSVVFGYYAGAGWIGVTAPITANTWVNVVGTFVGNTRTQIIYVNGVPSTTASSSMYVHVVSNLYIGRQSIDLTNLYSGKISNVSIYNRALSEAEVKQNFNALRGRYGI